MKRCLWPVYLLIMAVACVAQDKPMVPTSATSIVKDTPASDALNAAAKDMQAAQKVLASETQQATVALEASQKTLTAQLQEVTKKLNDEIRADKKYKPMFEQMDALQKQLQGLQGEAQQKFQQQSGAMQSKVTTDKALIEGLVPVVRKESGLPDSATYESATQTWKK